LIINTPQTHRHTFGVSKKSKFRTYFKYFANSSTKTNKYFQRNTKIFSANQDDSDREHRYVLHVSYHLSFDNVLSMFQLSILATKHSTRKKNSFESQKQIELHTGRLPRRKYINICPNASKSSRRLCSKENHVESQHPQELFVIPLPRCVFILMYLAVPVRLLCSRNGI